MPHNALLTIEIDPVGDDGYDLTARTHRVPPGVRIPADAPTHPLVQIVDTTDVPDRPLFAPQASRPDDTLRLAHDLFETLAVTNKPGKAVSCHTYHRWFRFWLAHYTTMAVPAADDLDGIIPHRVREGPRRPGGRKRYYTDITLNVTPYIVLLGHHSEVPDGY